MTVCLAGMLLFAAVSTEGRAQTGERPGQASQPFLLRGGESAPGAPAPDSGSSAPASSYLLPEDLPDDLPAHLLVVYNATDPDSRRLADYYAQRRSIAPDHVLGINCPQSEEITHDIYNSTIREPIISYIYDKGWMSRRSEAARTDHGTLDLLVATRNDVWAIVLMRGVPLRIANDPTDVSSMQAAAVFKTNAAAVDSELALLPVFGLPSGGFVANPFFDDVTHGMGRVGPALATKMILVTRLDGPTPADVRRMIDDSIAAEQHRLAGLAVIDTRGFEDLKNPYTMGDTWLRGARDLLAQQGWPVKFDASPDVLPASDPCNEVALYLGWYHDGAIGPWVTPPNRFVPGAIAYHLHSYSATTLRSPTQGWAGPLLAHGAAATMGAVYEPYLILTPHLQIFTRRLLADNYYAEAAYASIPALSWMITVVGDPLYRPFHQPLDAALAASGDTADHHDWLLLQKVRGEIVAGELAPTVKNLEDQLNVPGAVAQEGLGDLLETLPGTDAKLAAQKAYHDAASLEVEPIDAIRVGLKLARAYAAGDQGEQAQAELRMLQETYPQDAGRFGVADAALPRGTPASEDSLPVVPVGPMQEQGPLPDATLLPPRPPKAPTAPGASD